ncbi:MAG TPA: tetratricopeptide repeat protein [Azospirillaceae bacterium]|nr:tetratricopeptide repeat protein [Azospirillaceae bacterium]
MSARFDARSLQGATGRLIRLPVPGGAPLPEGGGPGGPAPGGLAGAVVHLIGRAEGLLPRRVADAVRDRGGRLSPRLGRQVTTVAVAHGALKHLRSGLLPALMLHQAPPGAEFISEGEFRRRLGLDGPPPPANRDLSAERLSALSGLRPEAVFWLSLFDVLEPAGGLYGFRDLVAARRVRGMLRDGVTLGDVIEGALRLRREQGMGLSEAAGDPVGPVRDGRGRLVDPEGQFLLPLESPPASADQLLDFAELMRRHRAIDLSERALGTALRLTPWDPAVLYRLGEVLALSGRRAEAEVCWHRALDRDPGFSEASLALARSAARSGKVDAAVAHLCAALRQRPTDGGLRYALAMILQRHGRYREALSFWRALLDAGAAGPLAERARRHAAVCQRILRRD